MIERISLLEPAGISSTAGTFSDLPVAPVLKGTSDKHSKYSTAESPELIIAF